MNVYDASQWHDYFFMVGGGAAALTGLVFVAMTLHLEEIITDPVHRHRARTILTGLTAVFIRCALVLMGGQNAKAVAVEQAGAVVLLLGSAWGLYLVGLGMMSSFVFMVSGAWLLLVGVGTQEAAKAAVHSEGTARAESQ
jgi:hypothetical protein